MRPARLLEAMEVRAAAPIEAAELIVRCLEQAGVEYVFGIPGGAIEPLYNALARSARRGGPRAVGSRHESGAAFMSPITTGGGPSIGARSATRLASACTCWQRT